MQRSETGEVVGLEAIKWVAFALMVLDHVARYAIEGLGPVPWLLGRLVFPLFAIALGAGMARRKDLADMLLRLVVWGAVAQAAMLFAYPGARQLNVLFTFGAGVAIAALIQKFGSAEGRRPFAIMLSLLGLLGAVLTACASEYGPVGAALVASAIWAGRRHDGGGAHWPSALTLTACVILLTPINGTAMAVLALPVAWAALRWPVELPRVRRLFYVGYAAQWAAVGALAWVLR